MLNTLKIKLDKRKWLEAWEKEKKGKTTSVCKCYYSLSRKLQKIKEKEKMVKTERG